MCFVCRLEINKFAEPDETDVIAGGSEADNGAKVAPCPRRAWGAATVLAETGRRAGSVLCTNT